MKILDYYDEFFNNQYNRDLRFIGKHSRTNHAPKNETTSEQLRKRKKNFIKTHINTKSSKYCSFYCWHTYFEDVLDYQIANDDARIVNHFFFDFDKHFDKHSIDKKSFKTITDEQKEAKDTLNGKEYFSRMNELQEKIQDKILFENLLNQSWQKAKIVNDYFKSQGLKTYTCLSMSKGVHLRVFFKPIHVNNYNRIIHNLHDNLVKQFDIKHILDEKVTGKESNPFKSVERMPYTYNEKSGLRVVPFSFETDSLSDVIEKSMQLSKKNKISNVDPFSLSDYVNNDFHNGILKLDSQLDKLIADEQKAKEKLMQERIANGMVNGKYIGENGLFQDLRTLVRFICGDDNLVSEHDRYDKYHCHFHEDKSPSCIVGKKKYTCLSSNCKINKLNYFEFIKEWFKLKSDGEVKEKMVELQTLYDQQMDATITADKTDEIVGDIQQEMNA